MSISSILNIAKNALLATQYSIQITANNIANINTPGYSRQVPVFEAEASFRIGGAILGSGVHIKNVIRHANRYLERQLSEKNTELSENTIYRTYFDRIENLINEDHSKLSYAVTQFFNSWHELSLDPLSVTAREIVKANGENLARIIRDLYNNLFQIQIELDEKLKVEIEDINRMTKEIAELNRRIFENSQGTQGDNNLMDKRQVLLRELSGKLKITYFEDDFGMFTVLTKGGRVLVDGGKSYSLSAIETGQWGFSGVAWVDPQKRQIDITGTLEGGGLHAIIKMRDEALQKIISDLDFFAKTLIREVNNLHVGGYTLAGTTGIPFFKDLTEYFAKDIDLSEEVKSNSKNIAASEEVSALGVPVGNAVAYNIASLIDKRLDFETERSTFTDFLSALNSRLGQLARNANELEEFSRETYTMIEKQRESISGVSIDEEIANLIRFQYAYQAASRLFSAADELFRSIIEAVR